MRSGDRRLARIFQLAMLMEGSLGDVLQVLVQDVVRVVAASLLLERLGAHA